MAVYSNHDPLHNYASGMLYYITQLQKRVCGAVTGNGIPSHQPFFEMVAEIEQELARALSFPVAHLSLRRLRQIEDVLTTTETAFLYATHSAFDDCRKNPLDSQPGLSEMKQYLETAVFYLKGDHNAVGQRIRKQAWLHIITNSIKGAEQQIKPHRLVYPCIAYPSDGVDLLPWYPTSTLGDRYAANWIMGMDEAALAVAFGEPKPRTNRRHALESLHILATARQSLYLSSHHRTGDEKFQNGIRREAKAIDILQNKLLRAFSLPEFPLKRPELITIRAGAMECGRNAGYAALRVALHYQLRKEADEREAAANAAAA